MKRWAYLGSIILGVYLAFLALRAPQPSTPTCSMPAWHVVFPPVHGEKDEVPVFDSQAPTQQWNKAVDYFPTIGECQRDYLKRSASDELEYSARFPHQKEFEQQFRMTALCVCADDPRFN